MEKFEKIGKLNRNEEETFEEENYRERRESKASKHRSADIKRKGNGFFLFFFFFFGVKLLLFIRIKVRPLNLMKLQSRSCYFKQITGGEFLDKF